MKKNRFAGNTMRPGLWAALLSRAGTALVFVCFGVVTWAHAQEPAPEAIAIAESRAESGGGPSEASGYKIYRRGFYEAALKEWRLAAEKGDAGAAFRLGEEYFDAKTVERDLDEALKWYRLAARGGDPRAQMDLATCYDHGWGVKKDLKKAAQWYLSAARKGMAEAQYNVATMYETGTGIGRDPEAAYMYYSLAVEGGFAHFATIAMDNLSRMMGPGEIKRATAMAREFVPEGREAVPDSE